MSADEFHGTEDEKDGDDGLRSFIESGGQVVGQVAGAALSLAAGPLVGAATGTALSEVLARVGRELHDRFLAPRQGARAAGALDVAWVRIDERLQAGEELRQDGFFDAGDDGRVDAEELLEGTLVTAANAWEERKVPFIGNLYANLAFDERVTPGHAGFLLRLADRLTYGQLCILAFFARTQAGEYADQIEAAGPAQIASGRLPDGAVMDELNDLTNARLLGVREDGAYVTPPSSGRVGGGASAWHPTHLRDAALMPLGETLHCLMALDEMPAADVEVILSALRGEGHGRSWEGRLVPERVDDESLRRAVERAEANRRARR